MDEWEAGDYLYKKIQLISIIGEIEGHEFLAGSCKTTKYEKLLPKLAWVEQCDDIEGVLFLINTIGGDVESGLAIAEMIYSMKKPTVSLVLGGSHSIGVPLAVATDYSFIVPTGAMVLHPVRYSGTVLGAKQTYFYLNQMQERILDFIERASRAKREQLLQYIMNTDMLSRDLGTILIGEEAVRAGLINEVGGISESFCKVYDMIQKEKNKNG